MEQNFVFFPKNISPHSTQSITSEFSVENPLFKISGDYREKSPYASNLTAIIMILSVSELFFGELFTCLSVVFGNLEPCIQSYDLLKRSGHA